MLARLAYQTHGARNDVKQTKKEVEELSKKFDPRNDRMSVADASSDIMQAHRKLEIQRDDRFKKKVEVVYSVVSTISSGLFVAGLFFPPLAIASMVVFGISKILQTYDNYTDYKFSRFMTRIFSRSKIKEINNQASEYKEDDMSNSPSSSPSSSPRNNTLGIHLGFNSANIEKTLIKVKQEEQEEQEEYENNDKFSSNNSIYTSAVRSSSNLREISTIEDLTGQVEPENSMSNTI